MDTIKVIINTPFKVIEFDEVKDVNIPSSKGDMTVLPNHIALVTDLKPGKVILTFTDRRKQTEEIDVKQGLTVIENDRVDIFLDSIQSK